MGIDCLNREIRHFLPAVCAEPVDAVVANMAQEFFGAARTGIHSF
jgi:hypothetical protein